MTKQPQPALSGHPPISARKKAIRRRFLESIPVYILPLVIIALPVSLLRIFKTGLHPNHITHIVIALLGIGLFFKRRTLSDAWIIASILILFSVLSLSAFMQYGLVSAGFYFASAAIFITAVALGLRAGFIITAFYGIAISAIAYLWIAGDLVFPVDVSQYILVPSVWATLGLAFLITTAILFVSASGILTDLNQLVDTVEEQKSNLEKRTAELLRVNRELEGAMKELKTLSGLLPICSNCKKIRDDQGYWQQVEHYVQSHSQATFTHGLCPECIKELYPAFADQILGSEEEI